MEPARRLLAVAALVLLAGAAQAYYLPGTYPQEFLIGDVIQGEWTRAAGVAGLSPEVICTCACCGRGRAPMRYRLLASARLPCCALQPRSTRWCPLR